MILIRTNGSFHSRETNVEVRKRFCGASFINGASQHVCVSPQRRDSPIRAKVMVYVIKAKLRS